MQSGPLKTNNTTAAIVVVVLAVSLWGQLSLMGLLYEVRSGSADPLNFALHLLPIIALVPAITTRSPLALLLLFPVSLLPSIAALPELERGQLMELWPAVRVTGTFAVYLALASAWLTSVPEQVEVEQGKSFRGQSYRHFVWGRLGPLVLLFLVPTYGIFLDAPITSTIEQNNPGAESVAQIFIAIVMFFTWAVIAYTTFLVPALNLEYDRRRIRREMETILEEFESGRRWMRLGVEALVVCVGLSVIALMFAG